MGENQLLDLLRRELVTAVRDAAARTAGDLTALGPDPALAGTAFADRALAPVNPALNPVLAAFSLLTGENAQIRGWREDGATGLAYVVRADSAVAAVTIVPGGRLTLRAAGFGAGRTVRLPVGDGFELTLTATTEAGEAVVAFDTDGPPDLARLGGGDRIEFALARATPMDRIGVEGGPSVELGTVSAGGWFANGSRGGHLTIERGRVALAPGFLSGLLPIDLTFPLDLDLKVEPGAGLTLGGSPVLRTRVAGGKGRWLDLELGVAGTELAVSFRTAVDVQLPGSPVGVRADGIGLRLPVSLRPGTPLLPRGIEGVEPQGAAVTVDLPVVGAAGTLARVGDDLAGALAARVPPMSASAYGVLTPARDGRPLSLLVIMGATFPPPGVQIGLGFAISGLGGVVGINRRIDRDAMLRAVTDGTAAQLLFPHDPVGGGAAAVRALPAVFPPARGSVVAGPMFQISWGNGRIVTLSAAVLLESATQVRVTVLGKLTVALPDPQAPLVFLQATFAGIIDTAEPSVLFVASLAGSHIVGVPLSGDVLLLTRGGRDPEFVLSAGGFHPAFRPPRGAPPMRRLAMDLSPYPWIQLRCDAYFALTSNTMQLGAKLELAAEVAGCGLRGWFQFDALVQYSPFRFLADMSGGIALRALGRTLIGVSLALHLEGPAPYYAKGRGSIDLFFFDVSFDFEVGWGAPAPEPVANIDVGGELRRALADPAAWRSRGSAPAGVVLTERGRKDLSDARAADPFGAVTVTQRTVPLGIDIDRFNGVRVAPQRWTIVGGQFGAGAPARPVENRADFAPGQFRAAATDDEALTSPAFVPLPAGVDLFPAGRVDADRRAASLDWEESVLADDIPVPVRGPAGPAVDGQRVHVLISRMRSRHRAWWTPPPTQIVRLRSRPPAATAFRWSMTAGPEPDAVTELEMTQRIGGAGDLMTVEAWEVSR